MIRTIVCTGDSHTWGQGASAEMERAFSPPVRSGELRPLPFSAPCYAGLLREDVCRKTGSRCEEYAAEQIADRWGAKLRQGTAWTGRGEIDLPAADLFRIFFECGEKEQTVDFMLGDTPVKRALIPSRLPGRDYIPISLFSDREGDPVKLCAAEGTAGIYRIESYSGGWAVINAGVGSMSVNRYRNEYWDSHVLPCRPHTLLMEAHTINDWLTGDSPDEYRENLRGLLQSGKKLAERVALLTVSPIRGAQGLPHNRHDYAEFVAESLRAGALEGVPVLDAYAAISREKTLSAERGAPDALFSDDWHVNAEGHRIYAQTILDGALPIC